MENIDINLVISKFPEYLSLVQQGVNNNNDNKLKYQELEGKILDLTLGCFKSDDGGEYSPDYDDSDEDYLGESVTGGTHPLLEHEVDRIIHAFLIKTMEVKL